MQIADFIVNKTGLSLDALFAGPSPLVRLHADAAGTITIPDAFWHVPGVAKPTDAEIAAALTTADPQALAKAQARRSALIEASCAATILGGYTSKALGTAHLYGSKVSDQLNLGADLMAAATGALSAADIVCSADAGKTWTAASHTAAQIGALAADFRAFRAAQQTKTRQLLAQITAASTADAVAAIVWA